MRQPPQPAADGEPAEPTSETDAAMTRARRALRAVVSGLARRDDAAAPAEGAEDQPRTAPAPKDGFHGTEAPEEKA